jgi:hypothetical protein
MRTKDNARVALKRIPTPDARHAVRMQRMRRPRRHLLRGSVEKTELLIDPADIYRDRVDECRGEAVKSVNPVTRPHWLKIAKNWLGIAKEVARRPHGK